MAKKKLSYAYPHGITIPALIIVAGIVLLAWSIKMVDSQTAIGSAAVLVILLGVAKLSRA